MRSPIRQAGPTRPAQLSAGGAANAAANALSRVSGAAQNIGNIAAQYQEVAENKAISGITQDAENRFSELAREYALDPDGFDAAASEVVSGYVSEQGGRVAQEAERRLTWRKDAFVRSIADARFNADVTEQKNNHVAGLEALQTKGKELVDKFGLSATQQPEWLALQDEMETHIASLEANPLYKVSHNEAVNLRNANLAGFQETVIVGGIEGVLEDAFNSGGAKGARKALTSLLDEEGDAIVGENRDKFEVYGERYIQWRLADIERAANEAAKIEAESQSLMYNKARVEMADGRLTRADVDLLMLNGEISDGHYASLVEGLASRSKKSQITAAAAMKIATGVPLNPYDKDDRDAAELVWAQESENVAPENMRDRLISFANETGIVPDVAISQMQGLALNGNDEQRLVGMDTLAALYEQAPESVRQALPDDQLADVVHFNELLTAGVPTADALARIDLMREAKFSAESRSRLDRAKTISKEFDVSKVERAFDMVPVPFVGRVPFLGGDHARERALIEYKSAFEIEFAKHGKQKIAEKVAGETLKRVYGETKVLGGGRIMAYPPERFYAVKGKSNDWMERQLKADIEDFFGVRGRRYEPKDVRLIADQKTAAEAQSSGKPGYIVQVTDDDGGIEQIPGRFYFDNAPIKANIERENLNRGKRRRAIGLENQENDPTDNPARNFPSFESLP